MNGKSILIVSCVFPPEPVVSATMSYDIARELAVNHDVRVISPRPSRPSGYNFKANSINIDNGFSHIIANSYTSPKPNIILRFLESYSFGRAVSNYISQNKDITIVYTNTWPLFSQFLIVKACKKRNIKIVSHIQDIYPESLTNKLPFFKKLINQIFIPLDNYILQNSTRIVTISYGMKNYLVRTRKIREQDVETVFNWQKIPKLKKADSESVFTFLYLGSLSPSAQIESVIHGFSGLDYKKSRLIIAGNGSEKENLKKIASEYPKAHIHFIDAPADEALNIQSRADILVLPLREGVGKLALPSKLISYMFSEKPILAIVEEDCDVEKIVDKANCGWTVKQNDMEMIKKTMNDLIGVSQTELNEKGYNALKYARNHLAREVNINKIKEIIIDEQ